MGCATIERLCYWYPEWSGPADPALFDVSVELEVGVTVLGGDSGAGKSTLLRALNGLVPHFYGGRIAGRAEVAGMDVASTPTRELARHVGFVFQEPEAGFVRGTVAREVAFGPENLGFRPAQVAQMVAAVLEAVGIAGLGGRRLATLSGGERQRVALAGALAAAPEVVALDEPTSSLDEAGALALGTILDDLARDGHTVVVAEQRTGWLRGASKILAMRAGRLCEPAEEAMRATPPRPRQASPGPGLWALEAVTAGVAGHPVLQGVELWGSRGEVLVLTGPNGAGKTTLLRTIAGLTPPLAGVVRGAPGGCRTAYLPQDPGALLHRRTVAAEVAQTLRWSGRSDDPMRMLDQLGLGPLAGRDPRDLSAGQRQRAALATVLVGRPDLALLDEPTRGMDSSSRLALAEVLRELAGQGCSIVLATHDGELAQELGDRVLLVQGGRVVPRLGPSAPAVL